MTPGAPYVEVDGAVPTVEVLAGLVHRGYGHFTAMQVRGGVSTGTSACLRGHSPG